MPGLAPGIHVLASRTKNVDGREKPGHDEIKSTQTHRRAIMAKVLVLYYSAYGHIEAMANAVAEGAREAGATVDIKRVPELVPSDVAKASYYKVDQAAPVAKVEDLANYDAIVVGTGTRFGRMASQMAAFLDQTGGLWMPSGALNGKVGGAFTSTASQHGGQETTLFSDHHQPAAPWPDHRRPAVQLFQGQLKLDEVTGGSPYGATTIAGRRRRSRQPSENELAGARHQGEADREDREKAAWLMRHRRRSLGRAPPSHHRHVIRSAFKISTHGT